MGHKKEPVNILLYFEVQNVLVCTERHTEELVEHILKLPPQ
jgi:hypothetical protein